MPQMAPLNWINLFMVLSMTFITISSTNYFSFIYKTKKTSKSKNKNMMNWKW